MTPPITDAQRDLINEANRAGIPALIALAQTSAKDGLLGVASIAMNRAHAELKRKIGVSDEQASLILYQSLDEQGD